MRVKMAEDANEVLVYPTPSKPLEVNEKSDSHQ